MEIRYTLSAIEILHSGTRVASHARSACQRKYQTRAAYLPAADRKHLEWLPSLIIARAAKPGLNTACLVERMLKSRHQPEQGYRSCLGVVCLAQRYPEGRMEAEYQHASPARATSRRSVKSILDKGLGRIPFGKPEGKSPHRPL